MSTKSNEENEYKFSTAELADFKRFWESEVGEKYKGKIKRTKEQLLEAAMGSVDKDYVLRSVCIANGLESILLDIKATIENVKNKERKEKPQEDTKYKLD